MKKIVTSLIVACVAVFANALASFYLCGPDEDGCDNSNLEYCSCIYKISEENQSQYCLDFQELGCEPLKQHPQCNPHDIIMGQGRCLSTLFQSMPEPICPTVSKNFCVQHKIRICNSNGQCKSGKNHNT